jgi:formylglycine-generating enzyme required for sulfatase activity
MISLVVAALTVGVFFYVGTTYRVELGGELERPTAGHDQGEVTPQEAFRDTLKDGSQGPEMIPIQGGTFQMGCVSGKTCQSDELPVHEVQVRPFAMGRTEVTFDQYDQFAVATGRPLPKDKKSWGRGDRPVIYVSWDDAVAYAQWLRDETGKPYRLPTEAEWEYAARAGTKTPLSTGDCIHTDQANYDGNYGYMDCGAKTSVYRGKTVRSGSLPANPWGLHEVHGNVWEWTKDCWHGDYNGSPPVDGTAWEEAGGGECGRRVVRGGSWNDRPRHLRSAFRDSYFPDGRLYFIGFRLAQDL